jgi:hypothetical protein
MRHCRLLLSDKHLFTPAPVPYSIEIVRDVFYKNKPTLIRMAIGNIFEQIPIQLLAVLTDTLLAVEAYSLGTIAMLSTF